MTGKARILTDAQEKHKKMLEELIEEAAKSYNNYASLMVNHASYQKKEDYEAAQRSILESFIALYSEKMQQLKQQGPTEEQIKGIVRDYKGSLVKPNEAVYQAILLLSLLAMLVVLCINPPAAGLVILAGIAAMFLVSCIQSYLDNYGAGVEANVESHHIKKLTDFCYALSYRLRDQLGLDIPSAEMVDSRENATNKYNSTFFAGSTNGTETDRVEDALLKPL